ncbi:DUF4649 family protein [Streptococcus moroccensis]|uniref:30S ribosomal protein S16 n=1 Tax=Streptococcus moroccensis TaxID=1451356 RepID=A0ABT9YWW0_9STRE|nr:DUF4649 family protein [Streptococcus moroccensis]MDQ0223550.1 hypothetical protein [Streptococcus moroccensis]
MVEISYLDSYKQERHLKFTHMDEFFRAFAGCLTVPDHLKVTKVIINGHNIEYSGVIGDLYRNIQARDLHSYL